MTVVTFILNWLLNCTSRLLLVGCLLLFWLVFTVLLILSFNILLHWVDILLEDTVVKKLTRDVDVTFLNDLGQSQLSMSCGKSYHGLKSTYSYGN